MNNYEEWILKAEEDLKVCELILREKDGPFSIACFHAQQASEKFIKAFLSKNKI